MALDTQAKLEKFRAEKHSAFIMGYTGETGKEIVRELANLKLFERVLLIGRRKIDLGPDIGPEFEQVLVDFENIESHEEIFEGIDVGICCLGTTRQAAKSAQNFVRIDHDFVLRTASLAKSSSCKHFLYQSSHGADKNSSILYSRTKGQVEEALKVMHFQRLSIFRPGLLLCNREESRPSEFFFRTLLKPISYFFPTAITSPTEVVARAIVNNIISAPDNNTEVYENRAIHFLAGKSKKCETLTHAEL
ncbi:hypothetical protein FSP39_012099 [Pinctada imbricata]|uniref:Protein HTATIP2 n=1 Tax=Pinctada imbricata TaxID=66713 RepID=A0AA88YC51_PINIB|nr:hypothetical protein FSP39_012099 [Pinctada imbricata]